MYQIYHDSIAGASKIAQDTCSAHLLALLLHRRMKGSARIYLFIAQTVPSSQPMHTVYDGDDGGKEPRLQDSKKVLLPTTSQLSSQNHENPFAQFACQTSTEASRAARAGFSWNLSTNVNVPGTASNSSAQNVAKLRPLANKVVEKRKNKCDFVPMKSIPEDEQDRVTRKWQNMADPSAPLEVRRFQVLLAARLHARCQEPAVRNAMAALREALPALTAPVVSKQDPQTLALLIRNLQYYNTKAKQIVKAAREIEINYNGTVPEDEASLLKITGVGKVFADLLAFVNTRAAHTMASARERKENETDPILEARFAEQDQK